MAITLAKKTTAKALKAERVEITPEEFIAGADGDETPTPESQLTATLNREQRALVLVKRHLPWAAGAGALPLPCIEFAAIVAVQLRMLAKLSETYGVPFRQQAAKSIVATLMVTLVQNTLYGGLAMAVKFVPVVGTLLGITVLPAVAAAGTYAIGKVFITHFEAGGTFLEFDPKKVQKHFQSEFEKARAGFVDSANEPTK